MTHKSSYTLPFIALAIVCVTLVAETHYGTDIDLEAYLPLLLTIAGAGPAKSILTKAANIHKEIPENMQEIIRKELRDAGVRSDREGSS